MVDLTVSLLGVMVVLPAALIWAEQHGKFTLSDLDPRQLGPPIARGTRATISALRRAPGALKRLPGSLRLRLRRSRA